MTTPPTHFVRHMIADEGRVTTEYRCTAAEDDDCRTMCERCIVDEERECCQCEYLAESGSDWSDGVGDPIGRKPKLITGQDCNVLSWYENSPEESYCGPDDVVRGPDWQPVNVIWESDYCAWEYA